MKKYLVLFMLMAGWVFSQDVPPVTVSWDANTESDLAGYRIYIGDETGKYDNGTDVGLKTIFEWKNLDPGRTYFFVVTAYDKSGNESGFSDEVSYTLALPDTVPPAAPTGIKILIEVRIN